MINPLKIDPTRTTMLRKALMVEMMVRFTRLKRKLRKLIDEEDSFGLRKKSLSPFALNQPWQHFQSAQQIELFKQWLATQIAVDMLPSDAQDVWLGKYIEQAHLKGKARVFDELKKKEYQTSQDFYKGTKAEFLGSAFTRPIAVERVKLLVGRSYTDLKGITEATSQQVTRELVDGIIRGDNPRTIAKLINDRVDKVGISRALTLARTEIIRAHAEGALDGMELLGVDAVGVAVEWRTAGDYRVCPLCSSLEGIVMTIQEARGLFPRHGNCRCSPIPANVGESSVGQVRTKNRIAAAIQRSLRQGVPEWAGRGKKFGSFRPRGLVR